MLFIRIFSPKCWAKLINHILIHPYLSELYCIDHSFNILWNKYAPPSSHTLRWYSLAKPRSSLVQRWIMNWLFFEWTARKNQSVLTVLLLLLVAIYIKLLITHSCAIIGHHCLNQVYDNTQLTYVLKRSIIYVAY